MKTSDVIIIGAGAAGLTAAAHLVQRGRRVIVLEMGNAPARKVAISGGGRCNFTNMSAGVDKYFGLNPDFVRGALARVQPDDVLQWMREHNLTWVEKSPGQLFCASGAGDIIRALMSDAKNAEIIFNTTVQTVTKCDNHFILDTNTQKDAYKCESVIVATGGTSFATVGCADTGYKIAKQFGHKIIPVRPALCAIATDVFSPDLSGISIWAQIRIGRVQISDSLLFTHFGIGGPMAYRASVRNLDDDIHIDLCPGMDVYKYLRDAKQTDGKKSLKTLLSGLLPARVAEYFASNNTKNIADYRDEDVKSVAIKINDTVIPRDKIKLHTLASAEVVRGGIDTREISSKTMESRLCSGLFFAGEVTDIAGDLGGFNLHWAWASGTVAGENA